VLAVRVSIKSFKLEVSWKFGGQVEHNSFQFQFTDPEREFSAAAGLQITKVVAWNQLKLLKHVMK
jgi:hypothetical protein